jgi:hypothetical protein
MKPYRVLVAEHGVVEYGAVEYGFAGKLDSVYRIQQVMDVVNDL